jgi:hypothetical protein
VAVALEALKADLLARSGAPEPFHPPAPAIAGPSPNPGSPLPTKVLPAPSKVVPSPESGTAETTATSNTVPSPQSGTGAKVLYGDSGGYAARISRWIRGLTGRSGAR